ncbi:replicative DNA helicase, partial [Candidatus Sumerlaeota bacterium]|nr:replicative DNA helicase [Candidatus Sumerlaeota bacterium]
MIETMLMALASSASTSPRAVPQNLEAERALLGGMLLDNRKIPEIMEHIPAQARPLRGVVPMRGSASPGDVPLFSHPPNQEVFDTMIQLYEHDHAVDLTTLANELNRAGRYEAVGGAPYLASLEEEIVSTLYLADYTKIVVEKWRLRSLLRIAEGIAEDVRRSDEEPSEIIERSEKRIFEIAQQTQTRDFVHVGDIAADVMTEIEARAKQDHAGIIGVPSGFIELDKMTTGFRPQNLIILAARPSMGKSAFAMNIAAHAAVRHGRAVGIFSLEMSKEELNQRLMCTLARVSLWKVRANRLSRTEMDELHGQAMRLNVAPLFIDDSSNLSVMEVRSRARRLKAKIPELSLILIDYMQLMHGGTSKIENRQQEVSMISRSLKALARDLDIPVIALSQLSRQTEQRTGRSVKDKMPKLSDLRESGAIEQDADLVIFIHREFRGGPQDPGAQNEPDLATIRVGKQRNGP